MNFRILFFLLVIFLTPLGARANPFRGPYVCVPSLDPNASQLEFHIREGQTCAAGEHLARVIVQKDGSILLLPSDAPLPKEEQKELEEFKNYYGIDH